MLIADNAPTGSTPNGFAFFVGVAVVSLILLVIHELRFPEPILDLRILKIPLFDVSVVIILNMMLVVFGLNLLNPLFFQELLGYSSWRSGIAVLPRGFGTLVGMMLDRPTSRRAYDTRWLVGSASCRSPARSGR